MIRINLLPVETKVQIPKAYTHLALALVLLLIGGGAVYLRNSIVQTALAAKRSKAKEKTARVKELQKFIKGVKTFRKTKKRLERKLETIQTLKENQKGPLRLLAELQNRIPRSVWVTQVKLVRNRVTLNGLGVTLSAVGDLLENLKKSKFFSNIDYKKSRVTTKRGHKIYTFIMTARFIADPERHAKKAKKKKKKKRGRRRRR